MANPKKRTSKSKKGMRRSHHHLTPPNVIYCSSCGEPTLSHTVCPGCGKYRGRQFLRKEENE